MRTHGYDNRSRSTLPLVVSLMLLASGLALAAGSRFIDPEEVRQMQLADEPLLLVDARTQQEFAAGHIEGAVSMPVFSLRHREFPPDLLVVVYDDGVGSVEAEEAGDALQAAGHADWRILEGGLLAWDELRYPAVRPRGLVDTPLVPLITPEKLERLMQARHTALTVIDLRSDEEFRAGKLPGAIRRDVKDLERGTKDISTDGIVVVYDDGTGKDREAAEKLRRAGYTVRILFGGYAHWSKSGHEVNE